MVPATFGGPSSIALAYNRGASGDGCFGSACPYSTVVSFAVFPTTGKASSAPTIEAPSLKREPSFTPLKRGASTVPESVGEPPLMSLGWWCSSASRPDSPGIFDNHER